MASGPWTWLLRGIDAACELITTGSEGHDSSLLSRFSGLVTDFEWFRFDTSASAASRSKRRQDSSCLLSCCRFSADVSYMTVIDPIIYWLLSYCSGWLCAW